MSAKVLVKAAGLISKFGWCAKHYTDDKGRMCLMGSLQAATNGADSKVFLKAVSRLARYLKVLYPENSVISVVNDTHVKNGTEAVCLLLEAAAYKP